MSVIYRTDPETHAYQTATYLAAREKEGRLLDDNEARRLPVVPADHRHGDEWRIRGLSCRRLAAYLRGRRPLRLLDLGCGNGWMSHRLAQSPGVAVDAVDLNPHELEQADRLFGGVEGLTFIHGDVFSSIFEPGRFDAAVLASSVQYFPSLPALIDRLFELLAEGGEIHILDSPFYTEETRAASQARSRDHYRRIGVPAMIEHYHHHLWSDLEPFRPHWLHRPDSLGARLQRRLLRRPLSPFPWARIAKP